METILTNPIPCTVDGRPAHIVGYGAGEAIDYRFDGEQTTRWLHAGASRLSVPDLDPIDANAHVAEYLNYWYEE